jgi:predicted phosphoribosyltransferase
MGAVGAVAVDGVRVLNEDIIRELGIPKRIIEQTAAAELRILEHRNRLYRKHRPPRNTKGRTVILVDDGLATGATMRAAITALRHGSQRPARIVVAVPTAAPESCEELCKEADKFICLMAPHPFFAISQWYDDFEPTSDETVCELLERATEEYHNELQREAAGLPA